MQIGWSWSQFDSLTDSGAQPWESCWLAHVLPSQSQKQPWGKAHASGRPCSSLKGLSSLRRSCSGEFNIPREWQRHQVEREEARPTEQRSGCDIYAQPSRIICFRKACLLWKPQSGNANQTTVLLPFHSRRPLQSPLAVGTALLKLSAHKPVR